MGFSGGKAGKPSQRGGRVAGVGNATSSSSNGNANTNAKKGSSDAQRTNGCGNSDIDDDEDDATSQSALSDHPEFDGLLEEDYDWGYTLKEQRKMGFIPKKKKKTKKSLGPGSSSVENSTNPQTSLPPPSDPQHIAFTAAGAVMNYFSEVNQVAGSSQDGVDGHIVKEKLLRDDGSEQGGEKLLRDDASEQGGED